jgi:PAS domain S-box-containing protein
MITISIFAPLASCLVTYSLFIYVRAQRQSGPLNRRFELFAAVISLAAFCDFVLRLPVPRYVSDIVAHVTLSVTLVLSIFFLDFVYALTGRHPDRYLRINRAVAVVVMAVPFVLYDRLFELVNINNRLMICPAALLSPFFVAFCIIPGLYGLYLCGTAVRREGRLLVRRQIALLFWGSITSLLYESVAMVVSPLLFDNYALTQYSSFGVVFQALFIYYAIYKYHLFQVNGEQLERVSKYLFENIHEGVVLFDRQGKVIQVNNAAKTLIGNGAAALTVETLVRCIGDYDFNREYRQFKTTCNANSALRRTVMLSQSAIKQSGEVLAKILILHDITDQARVEQELQKIQQIESIGLLAAGIAHDFNNFLTGIITSFGLVKDAFAPSDERHLILTEGESAIKRAAQLTKQLLTFSRGGGSDKTVFSIKELIEEVMQFCLRGRTTVTFDNRLPECLAPVEADRGQLSQVFQNLSVNAVQAMPHGGKITVAGCNKTIDAGGLFPLLQGTYVEITVADEGIGIPEEFIDKIFDPYFTTKSDGTGLGLTTAFSIVNRQGGHITVASQLGKGTTFTVYLRAAASAAASKQHAVISAAGFKGQGRILIMDDDPTIRLLLRQVLTKIGFEVDAAEEGNQALSLYDASAQRNEKYAAAIVDLTVLKGMGGLELTRELLSRELTLKVIVASGYSQDPVITSYGNYGFCAAMKKPYSVDDVRNLLAGVLGNN